MSAYNDANQKFQEILQNTEGGHTTMLFFGGIALIFFILLMLGKLR